MTRLLLVDDDDGNRLTLGALLEEEGFDVQEADSYETACACIDGGRYEVVLLDLHLGDRSGMELVPAIRREVPRAAVLLITGSGSGEDHASTVDGVLTKGQDFGTLLDEIRRGLGRR